MKKKYHLIIYVIALIIPSVGFAQNINWRNFEQKNVVSANIGFDYGFGGQLGFGRRINSKMPILLNVVLCFPTGKNMFDDFKIKGGMQMEVVKANSFSTTFKAYGIFRRYQNDVSRLVNFGSEFSLVSGYFTKRFHSAAEFGFDKAIVTHIKHESAYKRHYEAAKDGWYLPTGGNFFYGLQTGYSSQKNDFNLRLGKVLGQDFKPIMFAPFYMQLGLNRKL
jgi:hypothetical protein